MDNKIIKAIIIIVILIGLYMLNLQQQQGYKNQGSDFLNLERDLIKKIIISSNEDAIELSINDSIWSISGKDSLTVKPNMITNLLDKLAAMKKLHIVTNKEEKWNLYGVDAPSGSHLALIGYGGNTLAYYVFGQTNEYNKCYARTDKNIEVHMLDSNILFQLRTDPNFWGEILKPEILPDSTEIKAPPITY